MANNQSLNFCSLFRKIVLNGSNNDTRFDLFLDLFHKKSVYNDSLKYDIPLTDIGRNSQALTHFLNGSIGGREDLRSAKLARFLSELENYLFIGNNLNEEGFEHICDHICDVLKNWLQDKAPNNDDIKNIIKNSPDIQEKIIDVIKDFKYELSYYDGDIKEEINERLGEKDAISMLTWAILLSLFPEVRGPKNELKNAKIYKCFLKDDSVWAIVKDGIPMELLNTEKLMKEAVSGIKDYTEEKLERDFSQNAFYFIPEKIKKWTKENQGESHLSFIRYALIRTYRAYIDGMHEIAKEYSGLTLKVVKGNECDEPMQYELIKLKYIYALSLWKLREFSDEDAVLNEIRRSLLYVKDSKKYRLITASILKLLATSANRNFNCSEAVNDYIGAYMLTSSTNYMLLSSLKNNLAIALKNSMKIDASCYEYYQSLELRSRVCSQTSFFSMRLKMNYAGALGAGRQYEKAIKYANEAYEYRKEAFERNKIGLREFHTVTTIYARILIHQAWDMMNSENIDPNENTCNELMTDIKHTANELISLQLINCVTRGLYNYIISFSEKIDEKICLENALKEFEKSRNISDGMEFKTNTITIHAALCEIIEGKIHYRFFMNNNNSDELKAAAEHIGHGFSVIKNHYNSLIEKSYFAYHYGIACFHLGALLSLGAKKYVKEKQRPSVYLNTALEMFEKCSEPDTSN